MANRFLNNIRINDEYTLPAADGTADQIIVTDGAGNLSFIDTTTISVGESEQVHIACKNTSGVPISKGDPVYIIGTVGTSFRVQIAAADASNSAKMPAVGLAESDLANNAEGYVIVSGVLKNLTTDPLSTGDGTPSSNDTVYVKAGGGLTRTKPTGSSNLIQNVGKVGRVNSANAGSLAVSTIMRTNDVPNLTTGKIWVGSSTYTTESGVVHLDEANGRMGINTASPTYGDLEVYKNGSHSRVAIHEDAGTHEAILHFRTGGNDTYFRNTYNKFFIDTESTPNALTLDTSGNVGIGTTSPGTKLDVVSGANSQFRITANDSSPTTMMMDTTTGNTDRIRLKNDAGVFKLAVQNSTDAITVSTSANVGIGTTSPAYELDVRSSAADTSIYVKDGATGAPIRLRSSGGGEAFIYIGNESSSISRTGGDLNFNANSIDMTFSTNNGSTKHMFISTTGNVGIGTTSPGHKLHVVGGNIFGSSNVLANNNVYAAGPNGFVFGSSTSEGEYIYRSGNDIRIYANGGDRLSVLGSGNVGIGTTSPASRLHTVVDLSVSTTDYASGSAGSRLLLKPFASTGNTYSLIQAQDVGGASNNALALQPYGDNVGIGETSPSQKLHVSGNIRVTGAYYDSNNSAGTSGQVLSSTATGTDWVSLSEIQGVDGTGTANYVTKWSDVDTITDSVIYDNGTNVGIGTTSPSNKLDIAGGLEVNAEAYIRSTSNVGLRIQTTDQGITGTDGLRVGLNSTHAFVWQYEALPLSFATSNSERVRIDASGNVGIGTTSPVGKLEVQTVDANRYIRFKAPNGEERFQFYTGGTGNPAAQFMYDADGTTRNVQISAGGTSYFNAGNVGIGTTSPGARLDIDNGAVTDVRIRGNQTSDARIGAYNFYNTAASEVVAAISADRDGANDAAALAFDTQIAGGGMTERMRITSVGDVGIGTDSPVYPLQITSNSSGQALSLTNNSSNVSKIRFGMNSSPGTAYTQIHGDGRSTGYLQFSTNDTARLYINSSGNVGIGVTSPDKKLHILDTSAGAVTYPLRLQNSGTTVGTDVGLILTTNTSGGNFASSTIRSESEDTSGNSSLVFTTPSGGSTSERMRITSSGNVGIGTTSPFTTGGTAKLTIASNVAISWGASNTDMSYFRRIAAGEFQWQTYNSGNTGEIHLQPYGGNVGIGTTIPSTKLTVDGITTSKGFQTYTTNTDYNLLSRNSAGNATLYVQAATSTTDQPIAQFRYGSATANSGAQVLKVAKDNSYFVNTNVGIGTTSPSTKLEVSSSGAEGILISKDTNTPSNSGRLFFETDTVSEGFSFLNSNGLMTIRSQAQAGTTSGSTRVAIDGSGNVGIGTADPQSKLQVDGGIQMADDTDAASADKVGTLRYRTSGNNSYVDMCMQTGASTYEWINIVQNNW